MPTFVEITPDPFAQSFRGRTVGDANEEGTTPGAARARAFGSFDHVRRPVRGIQIKNDTYATIQVRKADGRNIPLIDAAGAIEDPDNLGFGFTNEYSNFLLQSVQEQRAEKMQVIQTFGEPFIFFFGEHPRIISASGVLLNTEDFNWRAEFWENYDKHLRGTKCVQNKTRITMSWDDIVIEGYFIKADAVESATEPNQVKLEFQIFLTNYANVSRIGLSEFPAGKEVHLDPYSLDTTGEGIGNLKSTTQRVRELNSENIGGPKNSLLQTLRDGLTAVVTLDGQLSSLLELADRFAYGRNIRVPIGFAGGSVFDQETQIALASVAPSVNSDGARQLIIKSKLGPHPFVIKAPLNTKISTSPARFGRFQNNLDEFIARIPESLGGPIKPPDLFLDQKIKESQVEPKVRAIFEAFGVTVDPPREATLLTKRALFGLFSVVAGAISTDSGSGLARLRQATNIF